MRKFKLIEKYPGSPELGYILEPTIHTEFRPNEYIINNTIIIPSDYPKNWEEIIEKDYEIVQFHKGDNKIISIKRLSDGEIFTIGDFVECNSSWKNCKISKFEITNNKLIFEINQEGSIGKYCIKSWGDFKHVKQPLFKTEDGVDIFEGDNILIYRVDLQLWKLCSPIKSNKLLEGINLLKFSTKEKAEEYILMNKPCLSLNDLLTAEKERCGYNKFQHSVAYATFKELVKSKL